MDGSKVDLTARFRSREIFKLQSFPEVTVTQGVRFEFRL